MSNNNFNAICDSLANKSNFPQKFNNKYGLIEAIKNLPSWLPLVPVQGKAPKVYGWNKSGGYSLGNIIKEIKADRATGVGVILGQNKNDYLIALDFDGFNASNIYKDMFGEKPDSVSWTSGKNGRYQILFKLTDEQKEKLNRVEDELNEKFKRKVIKQSPNTPEVQGEQLEIRGNSHQSVLPPSWHPDTGEYKWIKSLKDIAIASLPDTVFSYIYEDLNKKLIKKVAIEKNADEKITVWEAKLKKFPQSDLSQNYLIESALKAIDPSCSYNEWLKVGSALKSLGDSYFSIFDIWSSSSFKYEPNKINRQWHKFSPRAVNIGTLYYIAKSYGWEFPKVESKYEKIEFIKAYEEYQQILEEQALIDEAIAIEDLMEGFTWELSKVLAPLDKKKKKNINDEKEQTLKVRFGRFKEEKIDFTYKPGERIKLIGKLKAMGKTKILDISHTGSGKTYETSLAFPDPPYEIPVEKNEKTQTETVYPKIWVCHQDYKNLSGLIESGYTVLPPRQGGMWEDESRLRDNGKPYLVTREIEGKPRVVNPNCDHATLFGYASEKGYDSSGGKLSPICLKCRFLQNCLPSQEDGENTKLDEKIYNPVELETSTGGFGYISERVEILNKNRLLVHPTSLPVTFNYSDSTMYVDEAGDLLNQKREKKNSLTQLESVIAMILGQQEITETTRDYLLALNTELHNIFGKELPRHGLNKQKLLELLPKPSNDVSDFINNWFEEKWSDLMSEKLDTVRELDNKEIDKKDLLKVKKVLATEQQREWYRRVKEFPNRCFADLVAILSEQVKGDIKITQRSELITVVRNDTFASILSECKTAIFMDATLSKERLAALINCAPSEIVVICSTKDVKDKENLEVLLYRLEGDSSNNITQRAIERFAELNKEFKNKYPNSVTIVPKKYKKEMGGDAHDHGQTRGANIFSGKDILYKNCLQDIGAITTDYILEQPNMSFNEYYKQRQLDSYVQLIGRTRFTRSTRKLTVALCLPKFITLEDLQGRGVDAEARELALDYPTAAPKRKERAIVMVKRVLNRVRKLGKYSLNLTQSKLAKYLGVHQSNLSRFLKSLGTSIKELEQLCVYVYKAYIEKRINGNSTLNLQDVKALADAINLDTQSFLEFLLAEFRESPKQVLSLLEGVESLITPLILEKLVYLRVALVNFSSETPPSESKTG